MNVIGYVRVSSEEQARSGLGLEAQRETIAAEAARRGWEVTWIEDAGHSARTLRRPGVAHALSLLASHQADVLVVAKLDRLSRSVQDFSATMDTARKQGWALVALDLGVDTTTPAGELVANVMAAVAQWERRVIGVRTSEALAASKARGKRLGRPRLTDDAVVAHAVGLAASGLSHRAIATALTAAGTPTTRGAAAWHASSVRRLLRGHALDAHAAAVVDPDVSIERSA